ERSNLFVTLAIKIVCNSNDQNCLLGFLSLSLSSSLPPPPFVFFLSLSLSGHNDLSKLYLMKMDMEMSAKQFNSFVYYIHLSEIRLSHSTPILRLMIPTLEVRSPPWNW